MTNPFNPFAPSALWPGKEVTDVPAAQQKAFAQWLKKNKVVDLDAPGSYYDYRGAFMAGLSRGENGHWPDTYKQHGHPTFSIESQYALPNDPEAGRWEGEQYIPAHYAHVVRAIRSVLWGK